MLKQLNEAKDLDLFKKIVSAFAAFIEQQPGTGMGKIYKQLLNAGLKCMPKDARALDIISSLMTDNTPKSVQDLVNTNFASLPITVRPLYRHKQSKLVAFWSKSGQLYSKVFDLLDLNGAGSAGFWADEQGKKIDLLELDTKED